MNLDPRGYPEEVLPRCCWCSERSAGRDGCLNPECPSHALCEWCRERPAIIILDDRLCAECAVDLAGALLRAFEAKRA